MFYTLETVANDGTSGTRVFARFADALLSFHVSCNANNQSARLDDELSNHRRWKNPNDGTANPVIEAAGRFPAVDDSACSCVEPGCPICDLDGEA